MNAAILNRDFEHPSDGWYQIEPPGEHLNRAANVVQVIDDMAARSIVNRFNEEASAPNFPGMLIDHEHFKHDASKETLAYGWLMELRNRNGIEGRVRWTNTGKQAVDGGDYRFFSTEYNPSDATILNHSGELGGSLALPKRIRPLKLAGLTLTNDPNNKGGRPITNREKEFRQGAGAPGAEKETTVIQNKKMKTVCARLGLSADASEEAALVEVGKLINRAELAEKALDPLKNRNTELEKTNKELLTAQVDSDLERFKNRFKAELKEKWKAALLTNRAQSIELLEGMPEIGASARQVQTPIHNRATAKDPKTIEGSGDKEATDADKAKAKMISNRAAELTKANPKRGFAACWTQAEAEVGAQFAKA
jgi:hypothetical protein